MSNDNVRKLRLKAPLQRVREGGRNETAGTDHRGEEQRQLAAMRAAITQDREELEKKEGALAEKERRFDRQLERLANLIASAEEEQVRILQASEEEIVSLSLTIVEKVLQSEIENGRYEIGRIVESTLKNVKNQSDIAVRVHPDDYEMASVAVEKIGPNGAATSMKVIPDGSIAPASCRIETGIGKVYSDISGRLHRIKEALLPGEQREQE